MPNDRGFVKENELDIRGKQFGARLGRRGPDDPHIIVELYSEDDENWFPMGEGFSSYWLKSLESLLLMINASLKHNCEPEPNGFGYRFREGDSDGSK